MTLNIKETNLYIITGMDGTGKTTLAKSLVNEFKQNGYKSKYVWMRNNHTFAYILYEILLKLKFTKKFYNPNNVLVSRFHIPNKYFAEKIWPIIDYISIIPKIVISIIIPIYLGYKVVTDRFVIDTINTLKVKNNNDDTHFFEKILLNLYPRKTKCIVLTADVDTILERRIDIEFTLEELKHGKYLYNKFAVDNGYAILNTSKFNQKEIFEKAKNIIYFNKVHMKEFKIDFKKISVIIPTLNRSKKLSNLLDSLYDQTLNVWEIIIIDQSDFNSTKKLYNRYLKKFKNVKTKLIYEKISIKNAALARNVGLLKSKGDLIFFIDDDVILCKKYVKNIIELYKKEPYAIGIQGIIVDYKNGYGYSTKKEKIYNIIKKILYLSHFEKDKLKVLPSINDIYPYPITKNIKIERMQGICTYKKEILSNYKFDVKLEGWSLFEDFDLSYNVYKSNLGFLYLAKDACLYHTEHLHNVDTLKMQSYKKIYYRIYMFNKNIEQTFSNQLIFYYALSNLILTSLFSRMVGRHKEKTNYGPIYMISGLIFSIRQIKNIKSKKMKRLK